jgi:hypothetical protein
LLSRSWIRNRIRSNRPVKLKLRACWVTQEPVGFVAARQVDAAVFEFDEEEHVEAAQRDRFDGEEVAGEHARGLLAQELLPAWARTPQRRPRAGGEQDAPDRARRDTQAEFQQLAGDPRVAPTRVLAAQGAARVLAPNRRSLDGPQPAAAAPTCDAQAPGASAGASVASPPVRGAGGAGAVGRAPQATRDQLAAAGVVALAVRARPAGAAARVTRGP